MVMKWSYATHFVCDGCQAELPLTSPINTCPHCGGLLEVQYDLATMRKDLSPTVFSNRDHSLWRWHEFYPIADPTHVVTLGEGGTPLTPSVYAGPKLGLSHLYFKNDTIMPTGSFKDRGFSLAISFARQLGITRGLTYTSGNAGSSFAAYASRAKMNAVVLVEYLSNPVKKSMISLYGALAATLHFESMEQITAMLEQAIREMGIYQFVNFINPVRHEAMKSYAYEISQSFNWQAPDVMVHPVGTGGGLWGAWKGFGELRDLGWIAEVPRMVAVQPDATGPIAHAFDRGVHHAARHGDSTKTIAQSIAGDTPIHGGSRILKAIYDSKGFADVVSDDEILEAMAWLGREGISAEPGAAASLAVVMKGARTGRIQPEERIVCVITGSGLKQPYAIEKAVETTNQTREIQADYEELHELLSEIWSK